MAGTDVSLVVHGGMSWFCVSAQQVGAEGKVDGRIVSRVVQDKE